MSYEINFNTGTSSIGPRYGIRFNGTNPGTRLYDAANLQFTPSNTTTSGVDDFINIENSPFYIRECVTKYNASSGKQEILAYEGDANWSSAISDPDHNRMIEFPKFYYNRPSQFEWIVSPIKLPKFKPSPMHYRNGVMHDKVYISKYHSNSNFLSQSGHVPPSNTTYNHNASDTTEWPIARFRNNFRSKGMYVIDYAVVCSIAMLMFIKYASMNIQSAIGFGWSNASSKTNTGRADSVKGKDGYSGSNPGDNASVVTLGIENWSANLGKEIDGIAKIGSTIYINTDIENITSNPTATSLTGYTACGTACATNVGSDYFGWIKDSIAYDSVYDWAMYATSVVAAPYISFRNDPGYFIGDGYWHDTSNPYPIYASILGGSFGHGFANGPLYVASTDKFEYATPEMGSASFFLS